MKDLLNVQDELGELTDLMFAAFMAVSSINSREGSALAALLSKLHQHAQTLKMDVDAIRRAGNCEGVAA